MSDLCMVAEADDELVSLVKEKIDGCRKELKEAACEYISIGASDIIARGMVMMFEKNMIKDGKFLTIIHINQGMLLFFRPMDEVKDIVRNVTPARKGKTAPRVLPRMAMLRILKVMKCINQFNLHLTMGNNWTLKEIDEIEKNCSGRQMTSSEAQHCVMLKSRIQSPIEVPLTIKTKDELVEAAQKYMARAHWDGKKIIADINVFFSNTDVTDQTISDGWDLYVAKDVTEA